MQTLDLPARAAFPRKPKIDSDQVLNEALHEIGYMDAYEAEQKAALKLRIDELTAEFQERLTIHAQKEKLPMSIAEYRNSLNEAIEKYCTKNRVKILEDDKKSREFTHGTIGWRDSKAKIDFCEGYSGSKVEKLVDKIVTGGVLKRVRKLLASLFFVGTRPVSLICEPKLSFSKTSTLKAYQDGKLKDEHLDAIGVCYVEPGEDFYIKPNDVALISEA